MVKRAGSKLRFQLVIEAELIGGAFFPLGIAGQQGAALGIVGIDQITVLLLDAGVARVLSEGQRLVDLMFKLVAIIACSRQDWS